MTFKQQKTLVYVAIPVLAAAGVVLDLITPLGIADWIWYFIPLLLSVYVGGRFFPYLLAAVLSLLTLAGFYFSAPGADPHLAFISRLMGIGVQWLMAFLISQRKRVEGELFKSRQMLQLILDAIPQRVFWKDRNLHYLGCNRHFAVDGGYRDPDELLGKSDYEAPWKALADHYRADDQLVLDSGKPKLNFEEPQDRLDGSRSWLSTSKVPLLDQDGRVIGVLGTYEDITWRRQAEEQLAEERNFLRALMANIPDGIYFKDRESRFTRVNQALARHLGLRDPAEAIGRADFDFFSKEHAQQAYEDEQAIIQTGEPMVGKEEKETWADGHVEWVSTTKMPLLNQEGQIIGTFGISRDITGRKREQQQLAETLDFSRRIITDAPAGIIVYKASGQCVLANEYAARTLNTTVLELLKQNFRQLESWRASGMLGVAKEALASGKPRQSESHFVSTFGKEVWLVCNFNPFSQGDEPHLLFVFNDATGHKAAEDHIREQAALLDKAQDAIFVMDLDDRIIYWNKSAERIYGWPAGEAIGKSVVELLCRGVITPQLAHTIKTVNKRSEWVSELHQTTKDGKTITVQGRCNVINDEQGRPKSRLIISTDITERKNLEIQSLRAQRMEGIGALASGIAHDLNNVLTPLLVSVQVLKDKVTDEDGRRLLQALEANVERGAGLVKQVLAFGRGFTGERVAGDPKHITREIKQIILETFPKSVEFALHTAADLWTITGDPTQLHQVLLNLCVNARDAMPKGGKLSILMENIMFDETYAGMNPEAKAGPYICITVTDTGTGIPKEIQDKIFDPFFTTKEPGKGTGLGLSTTLTIVKNHGGFILCHSVPGEGSRFEVYFPANLSRGGEDTTITRETRLPRGHNELVLVVDDEAPIRNITRKTLEQFGYRVLLAADGAEAVSLYSPRRTEISAVITDMVMPIMDGPATIIALKNINPEVKIISSSGMASQGGLAKAKDAGVLHFIPKPYTAATMLNTLHEVLNGK